MNIKLVLYFILIPVLLFSCVKKQNNTTDKTPGRIISLGPYITEMIYLLGKQDILVADTVFCDRPPEAGSKEKIGNTMEINIEKIVSLKPDIIFATGLTYPENINKLTNLGLKVIVLPTPGSFDEICGQFLLIGNNLAAYEKAKKIVDESKSVVSLLKEKTRNYDKKKIFMQIGANPLWTVNKDSYLNCFIEYSNAINIAGDSPTGPYSKEKVIENNPDIIFITAMGINDEQERNNWLSFKSITAVKNNAIFILDASEICSANPVSFTAGLKKIAKLIHPEISLE